MVDFGMIDIKKSGYLYVNTKDNVEEVWTTFASVAIADPIKNLLNNFEALNLTKFTYKHGFFSAEFTFTSLVT